jgi:D-alanine-D-alanine ligase-like ATP-grasp enzyme
MSKLRIGYTCNVRDATRTGDERYNEWEPPETVEAVGTALVDAGCEVSVIEVGSDILHVLERRRSELDLVFNNAEGLEEGELREAVVPFGCETLGIPHTGSSPKTFINTLDKATAKRLVAYDGVATPRFQVMKSARDRLRPGLAFPLMVKPDHEGTSIGITRTVETYHLDTIAVDRARRGEGIGAALLAAVRADLPPARPIILNVVTDAAASETLAFYRRSGFKVAGYVKDEFVPGVTQAHLTLEVR